MKKVLIFIYIIVCFNIFAIKFNIKTSNDNIISFATRFELTASIDGVIDLFGSTDYKTFSFKTSFEIFKFEIGLNFKFRFNNFPGEIRFYENDWVIKNSGLDTFFLYLDKIDFVRYGTPNDFIYFKTGELPFLNFGAGLIIENYHNRFFVPISHENGFFFKFDANNFDRIGLKEFPLSFTLFMTDMLDPDIFGFSIDFSLFKFFPSLIKRFEFDIIFSGAFDLNATENNRLSAIDSDIIDKGNHRNMQYVGATSTLSIFSNTLRFMWKTDQTKLTVFNEIGFLGTFWNSDGIKNRFGIGNKIGAEIRAVKINPNWEPLLAVSVSFVVNSENFAVGYFSSNYEVKRQKQYYDLSPQTIIAFDLGMSVYLLNDDFRFKIAVFIPVNMGDFYLKMRISIFLDRLSIPSSVKLPDLYLAMLFENGLNNMEKGVGNSNGGYSIDFITRNFRFYTELGFQFYAAKIGFIFGYAYPGSFKYVYEDERKTLNMGKYDKDIQKFIGLSASMSL